MNIGALIASLALDDQMSAGLRGASENLKKFGGSVTAAGTALLPLTAAIGAVTGASLKMAMDVVESENLFRVSFKDMSSSAEEWSKRVSAAVGSNEFALRKNAGMLFTMTSSMGLTKDAAFNLATSVTELAGDMASFYNIDPETAMQKLRSGLTGEAEGLKQLGILVDEATIKQAAYTAGLAKVGAELTSAQKVQARYLAIVQQTRDAHGDLARTLDSPTNQLRVMKEQVQQLAAEFGMALMPTFTSLLGVLKSGVGFLEQTVRWFAGLSDGAKMAVMAIAGAAALAGPALIVLGGAITLLGSVVGAIVPVVGTLVTVFSSWWIGLVTFPAALAALTAAVLILDASIEDHDDNVSALSIAWAWLTDVLSGAGDALGSAAAFIKEATGGVVDFKAASENLDIAWEALQSTWIAAKESVVGLAMGIVQAKQSFAALMGDDAGVVKYQKEMASLIALEKKYLGQQDAIAAGIDAPKKAAEGSAVAIKKLADETRAAAAISKEAATAARKHAEALAALGAGPAQQRMDLLAEAFRKGGANALVGVGGIKELNKEIAQLVTKGAQADLLLSTAFQKIDLPAIGAAAADAFLPTAEALESIMGSLEPPPWYFPADPIEECVDQAAELSGALDATADAFKVLGISSDSILGRMLGGLTAGVNAVGRLQDGLKNRDAEGNVGPGTSITGGASGLSAVKNVIGNISAGLQAAGAAIQIGKGIVGLFRSDPVEKASKEAAKYVGGAFSRELTEELLKAGGGDIKKGILLSLGKVADEMGKAMHDMAPQVMDLMKGFTSGDLTGPKAVEAVSDAWKRVREEATATNTVGDLLTRQMLQMAESTGKMTADMKAFKASLAELAAEGAKGIAGGFGKMLMGDLDDTAAGFGEEWWAIRGTDAAEFFVYAFHEQVEAQGLLAALDDQGAGLTSFIERMRATGNEAAVAMLAPLEELHAALGADGPARGYVEALDGMGKVFRAMADGGDMTTGRMEAMQRSIQGTFNALNEGGVSGQAAFQAIYGPLRDVVSASQQYGIELDANTQALVDQAQAAGFAFPLDPMRQMVDLMSVMVEGMGFKLPESVRTSTAAIVDMGTTAASTVSSSFEGGFAKAGDASQSFGNIGTEALHKLGYVGQITGDYVGVAWGTAFTDLTVHVGDAAKMTEDALYALEEAVTLPVNTVADALWAIPSALNAVPGAAAAASAALANLPSGYDLGAGPGGGPGGPKGPGEERPGFAAGTGGFRDFGTKTTADLHGVEGVFTPSQLNAIIATAMNGGGAPAAAPAAGRAAGGGPIHVHLHVGTREFVTVVEESAWQGGLRLPSTAIVDYAR